jgi:hypothetical protein
VLERDMVAVECPEVRYPGWKRCDDVFLYPFWVSKNLLDFIRFILI